MAEVHKVRDKRNPIAFMVRTRDLCHISRQTLPALFEEPNIDAFWIDGSESEEGKALLRNDYRNLPGLCEAHGGINIGQMRSWIYGLRQILAHDYEYIGFLDGDVLLHPGWLKVMLDLYEKGKCDGLHVGVVSARCITDRIMIPRDGYAVMGNVGGGMALVTRDVFTKLLNDESGCMIKNDTFKFSEIYATFKELAEVEYPFSGRILKDLVGVEVKPGRLYEWNMSADWWWEVINIRQGLVSLAVTPSFAHNIDEDGKIDRVMTVPAVIDPAFDWQGLITRLQHLYENPIIKLAPQYQNLPETGT